MKAKNKPQLIHQRRGGPGAPGGMFLLLFIGLPVACFIIAAVVGIPLLIHFILKARKNKEKPLPKMDGTPASESREPLLPQNNPMLTTGKQHRSVQIRPPRTSQIILLIVMVTLILGCVAYLLTH